MLSIKIIFLLLLPSSIYAQKQRFDLYGDVVGLPNSKAYLVCYNVKRSDTLSTEIRDGKFHFSGFINSPTLASLHFDYASLKTELYIESGSIELNGNNEIFTRKNLINNLDTFFNFQITKITGSENETLRFAFQQWLNASVDVIDNEDEKNIEYYDWLSFFIKKYMDKIISIQLLSKASLLNYDQVVSLKHLLDTSFNNTFEWKRLNEFIEEKEIQKNRTAGSEFKHALLFDTKGEMVNTSQYLKKVTLIEFWASWCGPCRAQFPKLKELYAKYKEQGFEIIGVSGDEDNKKWLKAIKDDKLPWVQLSEKGYGPLSTAYKVMTIPTNILIDENGKVIAFNVDDRDLEPLIKEKINNH